MSELFPCPFCGGEASVLTGQHCFADVKVSCLSCFCETGLEDCDDGKPNELERNKAQAIWAWNRRTAAHPTEPIDK